MQAMTALSEAVNCNICMERFTERGGHVPLSLPCGHTYCSTCCSQFPGRKCPECRQAFAGPVDSLPHNFSVLHILARVDAPPPPPAPEPEATEISLWLRHCGPEFERYAPILAANGALTVDDLKAVAEDPCDLCGTTL